MHESEIVSRHVLTQTGEGDTALGCFSRWEALQVSSDARRERRNFVDQGMDDELGPIRADVAPSCESDRVASFDSERADIEDSPPVRRDLVGERDGFARVE